MVKIIIGILQIIFSIFPAVNRNLLYKLCILEKENTMLKRKLNLKKQKIHFSRLDKLFFSLVSVILGKLKSYLTIVTAMAVLKWYHKFLKKRWTHPSERKPGRPETPQDIKLLIFIMKNENLSWGNKKIQGELLKLGIELNKNTIAKIIADFRKEGRIKTGLTWKKFLKINLETLFAMYFCTITSFFGRTSYRFLNKSFLFFDLYRKGLSSAY